ncbi:MAG: NAD-dependent epimerase/dehydratase family protein [Candidatus Binatia bacterium]
MHAFVTGSTGLLGNNLVRALVAQGHRVTGLIRSEAKAQALLGDLDVAFVRGDMRDVAGFAAAISGCDALFHTAAYFREYYQPGDHAAALDAINVRGTLALLEAADARGVRRCVHVSSGGTIGLKADGSPGDEDTPPAPVATANLYFKSKVDGDAAIRAWRAARHGGDRDPARLDLGTGRRGADRRRSAGARLPRRQGAGDPRRRHLRGRRARRRRGDGRRRRARPRRREVHRRRRLRVDGRRPRRPGARQRHPGPAPAPAAPVGDGLRRRIEAVARLTGRPLLISREAVRTMHAKLRMTSAKAERELGATFRPLDETLRDVVAWYRSHPR